MRLNDNSGDNFYSEKTLEKIFSKDYDYIFMPEQSRGLLIIPNSALCSVGKMLIYAK